MFMSRSIPLIQIADIIACFVVIVILRHQINFVIKQTVCGVLFLCIIGGGSTGILIPSICRR
jgi:hypothetical protein